METAKLKQAHILMVDDDVATTCLMANVLNRLGYTNLQTITDSTLFFDRLKAFKPDLILLDLAMPGLGGIQILDLMRQNLPLNDQVPVLVITGDASSTNKRKALAAGATDLLAKPFDPSEMNVRIRNILEARFLRLEIEDQNRALEDRVHERTAQLQQALDDIQAAQRQMVQQERLTAFAEMAGGVVHDFSNALMAVIGYSDILMTGEGKLLAEKNTALEYLGIINVAGRDAAEVVSRLRDFYRPRDQADLFSPVDLNAIAEQAILLAQPKWIDPNRVTMPIEIARDLAEISAVSGNASELREMLTNLIFNAADAMPDGGTVTVRTWVEAQEALIEVSDTGSGMTAETRARCLDPFFSTKGDKGTGLGLAMVFGIVKRHQGTLDIETELGRGTTFRIRLPLSDTPVQPATLVPPAVVAIQQEQ
ncbi:MAG: ATP-binding protein, partial [Verrucomicrobiota bacterium]